MSKQKQLGRPPLPPELKRDKKLSLNDEEYALIRSWREDGVIPTSHAIKSDQGVERLRETRNALKHRYQQALQELEEANKRVEIIDELQDRAREKLHQIAKIAQLNETAAIMVGGDWHVEENVDPTTVNWKNIYNLKEAATRAKNFFAGGLEWIELIRSKSKVDRLILALLGDIITGYIHEEYIEDNNLSPTEATIFAQDLICSGIDFLLKEGKMKEIIIPCMVGNHGRTTAQKRIATSYKNSFEWLMYKTLGRIYKGNNRVIFVIENGYHTYLKVNDNYTIRFHHGDAVKYKDGVGGVTIPMNKAIAQWNKSKYANLDVFGHFHQHIDGGNFIANASLIGYNAFAIKIRAGYEEPQQTFFIIDKDRGKMMVAPIFVRDMEKKS